MRHNSNIITSQSNTLKYVIFQVNGQNVQFTNVSDQGNSFIGKNEIRHSIGTTLIHKQFSITISVFIAARRFLHACNVRQLQN